MGIGNIVILKPSPSFSSSARATLVAKKAYIELWCRIGDERIGEKSRGYERKREERREISER